MKCLYGSECNLIEKFVIIKEREMFAELLIRKVLII